MTDEHLRASHHDGRPLIRLGTCVERPGGLEAGATVGRSAHHQLLRIDVVRRRGGPYGHDARAAGREVDLSVVARAADPVVRGGRAELDLGAEGLAAVSAAPQQDVPMARVRPRHEHGGARDRHPIADEVPDVVVGDGLGSQKEGPATGAAADLQAAGGRVGVMSAIEGHDQVAIRGDPFGVAERARELEQLGGAERGPVRVGLLVRGAFLGVE